VCERDEMKIVTCAPCIFLDFGVSFLLLLNLIFFNLQILCKAPLNACVCICACVRVGVGTRDSKYQLHV